MEENEGGWRGLILIGLLIWGGYSAFHEEKPTPQYQSGIESHEAYLPETAGYSRDSEYADYEEGSNLECHPSYSGCLDPSASDYDCVGGSGNGPHYTTDIANSLPEVESVLFDYFDIDEAEKTLTIRPLSVQAAMLNDAVNQTRESNPKATIDLICHSQGTIVSAIAKPEGVRKVLLLAPVFDMTLERVFKKYSSREGAEIDRNGISKIGVLDGYMRLVPKEYWDEREGLDPFEEYNAFAEMTELISIEANQDEVVPKVSLNRLSSKIKQLSMDGSHNFARPAREPLKEKVRSFLLGQDSSNIVP